MRSVVAPFLLLVCASLGAQESTPLIRSTSQQVLLDLVIRDKKERFVRDLKPDEIDIYEDGVKQDVKAFRFVDGREIRPGSQPLPAGGTRTEQSATGATKLETLNVISVVFDRMSPKSRLFAKEAANEFLKNELQANTYVGVFSLDYRLNALQQYTTNHDLLVKAIDRAATGNYIEFRRYSDNVLNNLLVTVSGGRDGISVGQMGDPRQSPSMAVAGADVGFTSGEMMLAQIMQKQLEMVTYNVGWRTLEGLMALVRAQATLPGRKTVLYLSEGVVLPWQMKNVFDSVVSAANRANVSIYCLDVTGLTTVSPNRSAVDQMRSVAALSASQADWDKGGDVQALTEQDERLHNSVLGNVQANMDELSRRTGGFLIANTNDLKKPLGRIMEDVRTHYELAYTPASSNYDGHFRRIEVKMHRAGLQVQTRNGYFALPVLNGDPVEPFEMACLKAIDSNPQPNQFDLRAAAVRFRSRGAMVQQEIIFEVPMKDVTFADMPGGQKLRTHLSFLGLIKDENGQVVDKVSRDMAAEFDVNKKEAARAGNMTFHRSVWLMPGRYTLESSAFDWESNEASVRRSALVVAKPGGLGVSSILLVRSVDARQGERDTSDPLEGPNGRVTPSLARVFPAGSDVPLYFVVYPAPGVQAKPELTIELFHDGKLVGALQPDLPATDETGAIPVLTSLSPNEGTYEVRVGVKQGSATAAQVVPVQVGLAAK